MPRSPHETQAEEAKLFLKSLFALSSSRPVTQSEWMTEFNDYLAKPGAGQNPNYIGNRKGSHYHVHFSPAKQAMKTQGLSALRHLTIAVIDDVHDRKYQQLKNEADVWGIDIKSPERPDELLDLIEENLRAHCNSPKGLESLDTIYRISQPAFFTLATLYVDRAAPADPAQKIIAGLTQLQDDVITIQQARKPFRKSEKKAADEKRRQQMELPLLQASAASAHEAIDHRNVLASMFSAIQRQPTEGYWEGAFAHYIGLKEANEDPVLQGNLINGESYSPPFSWSLLTPMTHVRPLRHALVALVDDIFNQAPSINTATISRSWAASVASNDPLDKLRMIGRALDVASGVVADGKGQQNAGFDKLDVIRMNFPQVLGLARAYMSQCSSNPLTGLSQLRMDFDVVTAELEKLAKQKKLPHQQGQSRTP